MIIAFGKHPEKPLPQGVVKFFIKEGFEMPFLFYPTITLEVNAVWPQKELDQAFCHSVTIRLLDKDRFQYVSNYVSRSEIEVTWYTERLLDEKWEECYGDN